LSLKGKFFGGLGILVKKGAFSLSNFPQKITVVGGGGWRTIEFWSFKMIDTWARILKTW